MHGGLPSLPRGPILAVSSSRLCLSEVVLCVDCTASAKATLGLIKIGTCCIIGRAIDTGDLFSLEWLFFHCRRKGGFQAGHSLALCLHRAAGAQAFADIVERERDLPGNLLHSHLTPPPRNAGTLIMQSLRDKGQSVIVRT